jgi:hypothetical protein
MIVHQSSYRGWDIEIREVDGGFTAVFSNEFVESSFPEGVQSVSIEDCVRKAQRCIDVNDYHEPQYRSASYRDVEPPDIDDWLIGKEK